MILANTVVSLVQEVRAKRIIDRIAILTRPKAAVVRDGALRNLDPAQIVLGDLLYLHPGDQVVVDGSVVGAGHLEVDESLLTGESDLVPKRDGDQLLSGSFCVTGGGYYEAERVGLDSYANKLTARVTSYHRPLTPLQRQVNVIIRTLLIVAIVFNALVWMRNSVMDVPFVESLRMSTVIVALIPNGLVLSIALAYALGAVRMLGKGMLIQQANAVESLSNVDVLCTDKTGTLTSNVLAVHDVLPLEAGKADLERLLGGLRREHRRREPHDRSAAGSLRGGARRAGRRGRLLVAAQVERPGVPGRWRARDVRPGGDGSRRGRAWARATRHGAPGGGLGRPRPARAAVRRAAGAARLRRARPAAPAALRAAAARPRRLERRAAAARPGRRSTSSPRPAIQLKIISGDDPATVSALARQAGVRPSTRARTTCTARASRATPPAPGRVVRERHPPSLRARRRRTIRETTSPPSPDTTSSSSGRPPSPTPPSVPRCSAA